MLSVLFPPSAFRRCAVDLLSWFEPKIEGGREEEREGGRMHFWSGRSNRIELREGEREGVRERRRKRERERERET